jgi:hypothetical protein
MPTATAVMTTTVTARARALSWSLRWLDDITRPSTGGGHEPDAPLMDDSAGRTIQPLFGDDHRAGQNIAEALVALAEYEDTTGKRS